VSGFVLVWGLVDDRDAIVIAALFSFGFGILLGQLEGPFKFGPGGVEGNLPPTDVEILGDAIESRVDKLELDDAAKRAVTEVLLGSAASEVRRALALTRNVTVHATSATTTAGASPPTVSVTRAAEALADDVVRDNVRVLCDNGHPLDEPPGLEPEKREPCPVCGSRVRRFEVELSGGVRVTGGVTARPVISGKVEVTNLAEEAAKREKDDD
jgi:hypothetical protein